MPVPDTWVRYISVSDSVPANARRPPAVSRAPEALLRSLRRAAARPVCDHGKPASSDLRQACLHGEAGGTGGFGRHHRQRRMRCARESG